MTFKSASSRSKPPETTTRKFKAQSAELLAAITRTGRDHRLIIGNDGAATARNIVVLLDGASMMQNRLVVRGQTEVTKLGPGARASYILAVMMGSPDMVDIRITWDDETGQPRSWESQLKVV